MFGYFTCFVNGQSWGLIELSFRALCVCCLNGVVTDIIENFVKLLCSFVCVNINEL